MGAFVQCSGCKEVMEDEAKGSHECPVEPWEERLQKVASKYNPQALRRLIDTEFQAELDYAARQQGKEYTKNDELRAKGVPFTTRQELLNRDRIAMMERQIARLQQERRSFSPRPIAEWFDEGCYDMAVKNGMAWVIRINFASTYVLSTNKDYGQENY